MPKTYLILTQDEQDEILVNTLRAQERDHFCYAANVERYTNLLTTLPQGPGRDRIAALLDTEQAALDHQAQIVDHTQAQLPADQARVDAATSRVRVREIVGQGIDLAVAQDNNLIGATAIVVRPGPVSTP